MMGSVRSNGCNLYYEQVGQGVPILLIHPAGATASTWDAVTQELGRIGRVLTYDRRGYARSGGHRVRSVALFRPALSGEVFSEPASTREMAKALSVSEPAIKQHLLRLYDKFGIYEGGERRRVRLANEALRRGAVTLADVRSLRSARND